jgi:hypothetical protein
MNEDKRNVSLYFLLDQKVPKNQGCKRNAKIILHSAKEKELVRQLPDSDSFFFLTLRFE